MLLDCFRKERKHSESQTGTKVLFYKVGAALGFFTPRGGGRVRGTVALAPRPSVSYLISRPGSGVQEASAAWILQPGGLVWTLALLGDLGSDILTRCLSFFIYKMEIMTVTTA